MTEMTLEPSAPQSEAEEEDVIERCLAEMKRLRTQINEDQKEIDRLRTETQVILAELRTL